MMRMNQVLGRSSEKNLYGRRCFTSTGSDLSGAKSLWILWIRSFLGPALEQGSGWGGGDLQALGMKCSEHNWCQRSGMRIDCPPVLLGPWYSKQQQRPHQALARNAESRPLPPACGLRVCILVRGPGDACARCSWRNAAPSLFQRATTVCLVDRVSFTIW